MTYLKCIVMFLATIYGAQAQEYWKRIKERPSTLGIAEVYQTVRTDDFELKLVRASQTVAALRPVGNPVFDFTPGDRLELRDKDSLYHLGDVNLRIRKDKGNWKSFSTATERRPVTPLEISGNILTAADLSNTLPKDIPVDIKRYYETEGGNLLMRFEITNTTEGNIEIGALGVPMIFNNILQGKSLEEAHAQNVFYDPYMGMDAGYLEVKRLTGKGSVLLVIPGENMPFEAYRPLLDDPTPRSTVFEGFHEWMAYSKAYAQNEWKSADPWNVPRSLRLTPGETKNFSLKFVLSEGIKEVQKTLSREGSPVTMGVPGYVLPQDTEGLLFVEYEKDIVSLSVEPKGALEMELIGQTLQGKKKYKVEGKRWGRARLSIRFADGKEQTVHYKVIKPEKEIIKDFGHFLTTEQWFDDEYDPFGRNPSVISYDYEKKKKVTQDSRAWISGLSDEGGAGSWLGAIMKQLVLPDKVEIKKLERFIDETLWGHIQYSDGKHQFGVKKSVFYHEPEKMPLGTYDREIDYSTWAAWDQEHAESPVRSYNYPHVAAAYWVMYRLKRYYKGLVTNRTWDWYLGNAYNTAMAMTEYAPYYAQFGQMEGSVFLYILEDLKREGLDELANRLESEMKSRANHWRALKYPFGSEMPWDSTGQEEVFMWSDYFGFEEKANVTLNAILAYMPVMPHWAYNGNARRYWDFLYAGKLSRIERQIHHYGSTLNAIPVLKAYRDSKDFHLLKVGYGGLLGGISNITQDGFGPAAFHSFPETLRIDYLSGDYGSGFYGYAVNSATYITFDDDLGWLAFGGNVTENMPFVDIEITTAAKNKFFLASEKLWVELDAGKLERVSYNARSGEIEITLKPGTEFTPHAYLRANEEIDLPFPKKNGAYVIKLQSKSTKIGFRL